MFDKVYCEKQCSVVYSISRFKKKNSIHLRYILNHVIKNKVSCKHFEAMNCIFIECLEYFLKLNYDNKRSCKLKIISNAENYFFLTGIPRL